MMTKRIMAVALLLSAAGCTGSGEETKATRSDRERDSLIAQSRLPGAAGVGAAMRAQDKANDLNARIDSIARSAQP